jgi:hypothetical protein
LKRGAFYSDIGGFILGLPGILEITNHRRICYLTLSAIAIQCK